MNSSLTQRFWPAGTTNLPAAPGSGWKPVTLVVRGPLWVVTLLDCSGPHCVVMTALAAAGSWDRRPAPGATAWAAASDAVAARAATARTPATAF